MINKDIAKRKMKQVKGGSAIKKLVIVFSITVVMCLLLSLVSVAGLSYAAEPTPTPTSTSTPTSTPTPTPALNPTAPVLGEAGRFVILASQKVTTTGVTAISKGDMGIEDQARTYYEGFTAGANPGQFDELTNGLSYAHDDTDPALIPAPYASTIAFINQVRTDLGIAYDYLAADPNPGAPTQVCPIELGGLTLTKGVYKTAADVTIQTGDLHLDAQGDPDSVWIFSIDGTLTTGAPYGSIVLDNGAQAENVYWRTGGTTMIGAGTIFYGNVFAWSQVNVFAGASITGRLFAVTDQVTLISDTVTKPTPTPLFGDLNDDGCCNIMDVVAICCHWGETETPCWIPEDLNCDGVINIVDIVIVCSNWGCLD